MELGDSVLVKELGIEGWIYEKLPSDIPDEKIYGIMLDKTAWAGGLATEVWHCTQNELEEIR